MDMAHVYINDTKKPDYAYDTSLYDNEDNYDDYTHGIYYYKTFIFERPLFLFFWIPLICLTTIANILVILVLIQKKMRTSTNLVLTVIACSDALTGLVTIPIGYIYANEGNTGVSDRVEMTEALCKAFMFLRYFLSRSFHTVSIWLTVLLAFHRMVLVRYPFKANRFFTINKTGYMIAGIVALSPLAHLYHAVDAHLKSVYNYANYKYEYQCVWNLEDNCTDGCFYMWSVFHLMHFVPCVLLLTMTALMMKSLFSSKGVKRSLSVRAAEKREAENKRVLSVVLAIVIVFLIPEMMYGVYRFVEVSKHLGQAHGVKPLTLITRRRCRSAYEVLLVLSFHANFWIYTGMNKKFRHGLRRLIFSLKCFELCNLRITDRRGSENDSTYKSRSRSLGSHFQTKSARTSAGTTTKSSTIDDSPADNQDQETSHVCQRHVYEAVSGENQHCGLCEK